jgi:hypothetical protein
MAQGEQAQITGHNGDRSWWQINGRNWISASFVITGGDCERVPIASYDQPPTPTPTLTATRTPTWTITPTAVMPTTAAPVTTVTTPAAPVVLSFTSSDSQADPNQSILLSWNSDADWARLEQMHWKNPNYEGVLLFDNLPPSSQKTVTIPSDPDYWIYLWTPPRAVYWLYAYRDGIPQPVRAQVEVILNVP